MKPLQLAVIGLGQRGDMLLRDDLIPLAEQGMVTVTALCDVYEDRVESGAAAVNQKLGTVPFCSTEAADILCRSDVDAVLIAASWESHIDLAVAAMRAKKYVGLEVGGAYSVDDCQKLVDTFEETGTPCMLLENCCYGQRELMILNMVRRGRFGKVVHCSGGYCHDLRYEISHGKELRHYRLRNYLTRNAENYPTHELGPIAKLLDINNGNRIVSLVSVASRAEGLHEYIGREFPAEHPLRQAQFRQGDIVTTVLTCANGETITLQLDTTLPRFYSRDFTVRGTKAAYFGANDTLFEDGKHNQYDVEGYRIWRNAEEYAKTEQHPIWKNYVPESGHDGMDRLVMTAFIESARKRERPPIDVYDAAAYLCITPLSEQSIALGGAPVAVPDFTRGKWHHRTDIKDGPYALDRIGVNREYYE